MQQLSGDQVSIIPVSEELSRARVVVGDHQALVAGTALIAAYRLDDRHRSGGYLFFTSNDLLFEEVLSVTLTDARLQILDSARIGAPYDTALWQGARVSGPDSVDFDLVEDGTWRLTVLQRPEFRLPLPSTDGWVWRGMKLLRYFTLERVGSDKPQS